MDWKQATDLGQEASWLIGKLQRVFDKLAVGEIVVEPPVWEQQERPVHAGGEKKVTALVIKDHLRIAKVFEPHSSESPPKTFGPTVIARSSRIAETAESDIPRWNTPIDARTCERCRRRHGTPFVSSGHKAHICVKTTADGKCRCTVIRPNSNKSGG